MRKNRFVNIVLLVTMLIMHLFGPAARIPAVQAQSTNWRADAVVLVNSASPGYSDFQHFIQPYLDHFGVPYTLLDIAETPVTADIGGYALIIVGHKQLDTAGTVLDGNEQGAIVTAVSAGTGLVNFDNDLSLNGAPRYAYVNSLFGFGYTTPPTLSGITFTGAAHYITQNHASASIIMTGDMTLAGLVLPENATSLATAGWESEPLLVAKAYNQGRAVQWGSYDWMSHAVKGPSYGLDDLVWRSLVWAARKPFVMQGMPPFVTFRMDDTKGPLDWIHIANEYGFIPWVGIFPDDIDSAEAADMSALAAEGKATFGMHAFGTSSFFYYNHAQASDLSDAVVAQNFSQITQWFQSNNIPFSKYVIGHYYELGTNVFEELQSWGVQFVGTMMTPGQAEANAQWIQNGPYRLYETGSARDLLRPVYYADYLNIPNHPELANQIFNCITEYRDIDSYEWHPSPDITNSVTTGKQWLTRAFNSMQIGTLFTHEYDLDDINMTMWRQMMQGITQGISGSQPMYVSLDYACQYARATHDSAITIATYNVETNQLVTSFGGTTDMPTKFYVFSDNAGQVQQQLVDVPTFAGSTQIAFSPPGQLHHISINPDQAAVVAGGTQQFSATGYDIANNPIPNLAFTWQVVNGGGSIDRNGLFTGGATIGSFANTVVAGYGGLQSSVTVQVTMAVLDHFSFDAITGPVYAGLGFPVTLRAQDAGGNLVIGYNGLVTLSDTTGTMQPVQANGFTNGVWTGSVTINQIAGGVTITASDGSITGTSSAFDVGDIANIPFTIWPDTATPANLNLSDGIPIELGVKFRSNVDGDITGLRFYKGASNAGTHTGHLWTTTGTLLATVTFSDETTSGWQQAAFSSPVAITAGTTYVASYFSPTGYFSDTPEGLATAVVNEPLEALANGQDGPNGVYNYGSSGFPTATWVGHSPNYWVDVMFRSTAGPDTTPPSVTSFSPASGATGVSTRVSINVAFSETLKSSTVNTTTFQLLDPANGLVPATVTYDSPTRTVTLNPTVLLENETTYTVMVKGGPGGVQDLSGNPLEADVSWTFTTINIADVAYTIWPDTATPNIANVSDGIPIELGVKFRSDVDGYITGLRFYKGASNTGTHTGRLWTINGTQLAQLTFTNETASDWQQADFSSAVAITAGTTYVASYFSPTGYFSETADYFITTIISPPLRALVNGQDGPNGVYNYGGSGFPTATWVGHAPNYWVDVVFKTTPGPDTAPPIVTSFSPASGATGVRTNTNISVAFSEALNPSTVSTATVELRDSANGLVPATVTYDSVGRTAVLAPTGLLANETEYTVTVKGGSNGIQDLAGNPLAADVTSSFTSEAPPPPSPNEGPGGPILILYSASNPFSRYYAEILRAEGLNAFLPVDITQITAADLLNYDVILLGEMSLTSDQSDMLVNWVNAGGNLIAMRPDAKLNSLMGLSSPYMTLSEGYLLVDTTRAPGQGIVGQTIQYHGQADVRALNGATGVATLYQDASTATTSPAVSINNVGNNGGQAAAFAFDLARSVVYTRQGNPAWAGQDRDGSSPIRSDDLFFGNASFDPQPDWVDLNKVAIPQADEQQRLLANLILYMNADRKPLPRFWYLPNGGKAVVLMTGDNHFGTGTAPRFDYFIAQSPAGCSVDDWECIRATTYLYPGDPLSNAQAASYQSQGFEIAMHLNTNCADFTPQSLATFYNTQIAAFQSSYPSVSTLMSARTHCIVWSDWDSQVKTKLDHAIRMDLDYYYWPATWAEDRPGFFTGSGMPMRFTDINGSMLDVYQAVTQMTDESGQTYPFTIDTLLDRALGPEGFYGIFNANMHNDYESGGAEAIVHSAKVRGVPVVSAEQVRKWLDGRNNSSFKNLTWNANTLTFQVAFGNGARGLQVLLPAQSGADQLDGVTLNGIPVAYTLETVKGIQYAAFLAFAGTYQAHYQSTSALPSVANDTYTTGEDMVLNIAAPGVLSNDTDPQGNLLSAVQVTGPAHGPLNLNTNGSLTYTPNANYNGMDSFTYKATNGTLESSLATVTITITPVNDAPVCQDVTMTTDEDTPSQTLLSCTDVDGDPLTYSIVSPPVHGTATVVNAELSYTPAADYNGSDTFAYQANDSLASSNIANVNVTVHPVNDPPILNPISDKVVDELSLLSFTATATDVDLPANHLTFSLGGTPPVGASIDASTGVFTWTPSEAQGPSVVSLNITVSDGAASDSETITVTAREVNTAPVANSQTLTTAENQPLGITLTASDDDLPLNPLTYQITNPAHGTLSGIAPDLIYTPDVNFNGSDNFTFTVNDGYLTSPVATVSITVSPVNYAPVAVNDAITTNEDTAVTFTVLSNDTDVDGDSLTVGSFTQPAHGVLVKHADSSFTYTPNPDYYGSDSFTYQASDGTAISNIATVTITIVSMIDPPVAYVDAYNTNENQTLTITAPGVLANDTNPEGGVLSAVLIQGAAHGTLTLNVNGSFIFVPANGYSGTDGFTYEACSGPACSGPTQVTIQVIRLTIFTDGFESGGLSAWTSSTTDQGDLSVTTNAALGGTTYGMQAVIDDKNPIFVVDNSPAAESRYTARFSFDPNSIAMSRGDAHLIFTAQTSAGLTVAFIEFRYFYGYQVRAGLINDGNITTSSSWYTLTNAPHVLEITWTASSSAGGNNGSLLMWVDGTRTANLTGIDNDTRRIEQVTLGAVSGIDNSTRGTYFFDEFSSHQ